MGARFLLASLGTAGDVLPYIGVGRQLRARGHDVVLLANEHFRSETAAAGLDFDPVGTEADYARFIGTDGLWDARRCIQVGFDVLIRPHLERGLQVVREHYLPGETVLVCSSFVFFGRIAQEVLGIPLVSTTLQPCSLFRNDVPPRTPGERLLNVLAGSRGRALYRRARSRRMDDMLEWVNDFRRGIGLAKVRDIFFDWRYSRQGVLGLWPDLFFSGKTTCPVEPRQLGFVFHDAAANRIGQILDGWRRALDTLGGRRPVVFTLGTGMVQGAKFFRSAVDACVELDCPGLLVSRYEHQIPSPLPNGIHHLAHAPFSDLLPQADAFVHHGGIGSIARGLAAAVPQLIVPMAFDQFDNAFLVEKLGAGVSLPFTELDTPRLTARLDRLKRTNAFRHRSEEWARRLSDVPTSGENICEYLERRLGHDAAPGRLG